MEMLKMSNISKSFFGITVLKNVDLIVQTGEVHALLGENGAGKSTLMNVLAGIHNPDSGKIEFNGKLLTDISVKKSEDSGIAFVHQELNLFNDLKVYENIFLRKEIVKKFGILDKKAMIKKTEELFAMMGVDINPNCYVSELETSKKQLLEISKALFSNAKLLILDEPTTALNNKEIEHLFNIVNKLKKDGKSFIFISHKMNEIFEIADSYTVLRNGEFIQNGKIADVNPTEVTKLIVGNSYSDNDMYSIREIGSPIIELKDFSGLGFKDVNLTIGKGEIIGLTGLMGAGTSELMQTIFGVTPKTSGILKIKGNQIEKMSIYKAMKNGIAMIASNRKENSILPDFTLVENNYVSEHILSKKHQLINKRKEVEKYNNLSKALNIKSNSCEDLITSLSGGNQQKVILARWLNTEADIILMDNPTQGIDVGAKAEIYQLILNLAKEGKTILVNTLEIQEIQKIADRCVVFFHGNIKKILERKEITEHEVMLYATNVK